LTGPVGGGNANLVGNPSFFQSLQGTARRWNPGSPYTGAPVLQHAPLYGCLGKHEYPGRWRMNPATNNPNNPEPVNINAMDNDPQPRWYAEARYAEVAATVNPTGDPALRQRWIEDNSYEWTTYREMWSLPEGPEGKAYYVQRFGDVFVVSLDANRVWRGWTPNQRGKFTERYIDAQRRVTTNTDEWGFGDINFRPFGRGSQQHDWLQQVLASDACRTARLRIVISHQTMAGLGDNAVPVQAEIRTTIELVDGSTSFPPGNGRSVGAPCASSCSPARCATSSTTTRAIRTSGSPTSSRCCSLPVSTWCTPGTRTCGTAPVPRVPTATACTTSRLRTSATPSAPCSSPPRKAVCRPARDRAMGATCRAAATGSRRPAPPSRRWAISPGRD
jgi:hypothetical protein